MPLLHVGSYQVRIEREQQRSIGVGQRICRKSRGQGRNSRKAAVLDADGRCGGTAGIVEILNGEKRRIESHARIGVRSGLAAAIEDSIPGPHYELVGSLIGKSDARRKIVEVGGNQSITANCSERDDAGQGWGQLNIQPLGHDDAVRRKIKRSLLIVALFDGGEDFVTKSQIQCELRRDFPVVLAVKGVNRTVVVDVVQVVDAAAVAESNQERCVSRAASTERRRIVGADRAEIERATWGCRLDNGELFKPDLGAEFERVPSVNPGEIVLEAVTVLDFVGGQEGGTANL